MGTKRKFYSRSSKMRFRDNVDKYYNEFKDKFFSSFKCEELTPDELHFVLNLLFETGSFIAFKAKGAEESNVFAYSDFAPLGFTAYKTPARVQPINQYNVPFIPSRPLINNEEAVIFYLRPSREGLKNEIWNYAQEITEIDNAISLNLQHQKMPFLITGETQNITKLKDLINRVMEGEESVYASESDTSNLSVLNLNAPYLIDKLTEFKQSKRNEVLTLLGLDNSGMVNKKERLTVDEVNSNNDEISNNLNIFVKSLEEGSKKMKETFGCTIHFKPTIKQVDSFHDRDENYDEEEKE